MAHGYARLGLAHDDDNDGDVNNYLTD